MNSVIHSDGSPRFTMVSTLAGTVAIPGGRSAIVVLEGFSMYLKRDKLRKLLASLTNHFAPVCVLVDCYTVFAARASKYKNPINKVGVTQLYGIDSPCELEEGTGLAFLKEHDLPPGGSDRPAAGG